MVDDDIHRWLLIAYNTPKQPSTARVTAWRRLHRLGALYIGPSTCLLPAGLDDERALATVVEGITAAGGGIDTFRIEAFAPETPRQAPSAVHRRARHRGHRGRGSRPSADRRTGPGIRTRQVQLRRGGGERRRLGQAAPLARGHRCRDRYGADGRAGAEQAVAEADRALQVFTERSAEAEHGDRAGELP